MILKKNMSLFRSFNFCVLFLVIIFCSTSNLFADDVKSGEKLFKQNCTACHMMTSTRLVGPGLEGVTDKYEKEWLVKWIRNSQSLIASGDERANAIFEEYNKSVMTSFDFQIKNFQTYWRILLILQLKTK